MVKLYVQAKKPKTQLKAFQVKVQQLDGFGQGIAYHQGKTIFVKNALPDESVTISITEDKKNYAKAKVIKYHTKSDVRITPKCSHYDVCGGCHMQHMPDELQKQIKRESLQTLLKKEANIEIDEQDINIISSDPYHYRRRLRLAIDNNKMLIGFRQQGSNHIIDINMCPVLEPKLEAFLPSLKKTLLSLKTTKSLGHVELIAVDSGIVVVIRHVKPLLERDLALLTQLANTNNVSIYIHGETLAALTQNQPPYYMIDELKLTFSPLDFIQVNAKINLKMISQAIDWLELKKEDFVLDLFCGMGNFSLPMAKIVKQVIGVEGVSELVEKAKHNASLNKSVLQAKTEFYSGNLEDESTYALWYNQTINKVLLDPARAGAFAVIDAIIKLQAQKIVYISCNAATLTRDSKKLLDAGYKIAKASVLDMFPQTKHIESMLLFIKNG